MYELIRAGDKSWYVSNPANVGVYVVDGKTVCLIDSGSDKEAGRKILKKVGEAGWSVSAIVNTHSNADHTGGNQFIQSRTNCVVASTDIEAAIARNPWVEGALLWGGRPISELKNKFLMAKETEKTTPLEMALPDGLKAVPLPGHYLDMIGLMADDGVFFIADSLFSEEIINKYHIFFLYDAAKFLETLDMLEHCEAKFFVPAHAEPTKDISALVAANRAKVNEIASVICSLCSEPIIFEEVLKGLFEHYGLAMDAAQYVLVGSALRSYLSWLHDDGRVGFEFDNNRMLWRAADIS